MGEQSEARPYRVSSLFVNIETLLSERHPGEAGLRLGARWSFGLPAADVELTEYSWPSPYVELLAARTGLHIESHQGVDGLRRHLARGQPAIAAVDSFHLPYRPAYGRVHSSRTLLVRGCAGEAALVVDLWPPERIIEVSWSSLEAAMTSAVPFDPLREPIFSGQPICGAWFSVETSRLSMADDPGTWALDLFADLIDEAASDVVDSRCSTGFSAFAAFIDRVAASFDEEAASGGERAALRCRSSLLLRAEISARVYLGALLRAAVRWVCDPALRTAADRFTASVRDLERARDLLVKSVPRGRPDYGRCALVHLRCAFDAELEAAAAIAALLGSQHDFGARRRKLLAPRSAS
jgi:hypothetical protein